MKRTFSILLCLMLVLSLAAPVFADGTDHNHVITINNNRDGYVYEAYQIFAGELDKTGTLSNIKWGEGVDGAGLLAALKALDPANFNSCNDAEDVATALAKQTGFDNEYAKAFADVAAQYVVEAKAITSVDAGSVYTITVNADGYYLIINTDVPDTTNTTVSRYVLEVVADVEVKHKGTFPTVDKKIVEGENRVEVNEASIGDVIKYEIVGTLPSNVDDYDTYFYRFKDTLSKGLTYNNDMVITVNGVVVTDYFWKSATAWNETTGTVITVSIEDILALGLLPEAGKDAPVVGDITKDTKVVLTYTATLNEYAEIAVAGNPNVVDLEYSNDPNNDGDGATNPPPPPPEEPTPEFPTGKTPEEKVESYTTELKLKKVDGTGATLTGAEFTLTGEGVKWVIVTGDYYEFVGEGHAEAKYYKLKNNTYTLTAPTAETAAEYATGKCEYKLVTDKVTLKTENEGVDAKAFVNEEGLLTFTGLGAGTYTLTETVTPSGYNTCDPITFTITFNPETKKFVKDDVSDVMFTPDTNTYHVTVKNVAGSKLPSTGGIGTTMFYAFGSVMFIGAAVLLITKKRMSA